VKDAVNQMRTVDLEIVDVAFGGKGVARENGKAVFVPFTIDGELIAARIIREKKQFAEAEAIEVKRPSPHRVEPQCPYFGRCGGCAYQHIGYAHQLEIKSRQVRDLIQRIGKVKDVPIHEIIPSPRDYAYRNRITVHAEDGIIGYFRRDSHRLIDIERCPIAMDEVNRELADLRAREVPDGHYTLRAKVDRPLRERSESAFRHFTQTNDGVANALRDLVISLVSADQDLLVDAYCGAGFFAKALVGKFTRVVGIDWDRFAIGAARESATAKESYLAGDVESALRSTLQDCDPTKTVLLLDPPATGLTTRVREIILDIAPATLIYISCNPSTLARDLFDLRRRFELKSVTPLDMFPQTAEIEVVAELHLGD
jgi:23S rRNA (uracil1939-C5)-methyltransferase